jgi:parallel beta-helix repeat protein
MEVRMTLRNLPAVTIRCLPLLLGLSLACPGAVHATNCNVYSVADLNTCFSVANANPQYSYTIILRTTGTYLLTKTLSLTQGKVYLQSATNTLASASQYVIDGGYPNAGGWKQAIKVVKGSGTYTPYLSISGITIKGGMADQAAGGGIYAQNANIVLMNSYLRNNASTSLGSGMYVEGTGGAYIYNSIIQDNKNLNATAGFCGGLQAGGGGVAVNTGAYLDIEKTTIMGNISCRGAGIGAYFPSYLTVENSTISGNKANLTGGGLFLYGNIGTTLSFNTISENQAGVVPSGGSGLYDEKYGGGIAMMNWEGSFFSTGNIVARNQTVNSNKNTLFYSGHDCFDRSFPGFVGNRQLSYGVNFTGDLGNCKGFLERGSGWWNAGYEASPADPLLYSLSQKTGTAGPQYTHAPKSTSPVVGTHWASSAQPCPYADQLGHRRDYYQPGYYSPTRCDFGAHQYNWYH